MELGCLIPYSNHHIGSSLTVGARATGNPHAKRKRGKGRRGGREIRRGKVRGGQRIWILKTLKILQQTT
jgi:hypothetical protein